MPFKKSSVIIMLACFLLVLVLDQFSKYEILMLFSPGEIVPIVPGCFSLTLTFNPGVAFGFLADAPDGFRHLLLFVVIVTALLTVVYMLLKDYRNNLTGQIALSMIAGGAIGNILDRLRLGHVVDFLLFYYKEYQWPAFNLADSAICLGVMILVYLSLFPSKPDKEGEGSKEV